MLKKIWNWIRATPEQSATPVVPIAPVGPEVASNEDLALKPKRKYKKKKVDDAAVYVDTQVASDLTAKGVDVDTAVETTLKKTSKKAAKSKKSKTEVVNPVTSVYTKEDWKTGFIKKGK